MQPTPLTIKIMVVSRSPLTIKIRVHLPIWIRLIWSYFLTQLPSLYVMNSLYSINNKNWQFLLQVERDWLRMYPTRYILILFLNRANNFHSLLSQDGQSRNCYGLLTPNEAIFREHLKNAYKNWVEIK